MVNFMLYQMMSKENKMSESIEGASAPVESSEISSEAVESAEVSSEEVSSESVEASEVEAEVEEILEDESTTEEEKIEAIRKLTLKVDGQEIEEELPFDLPPEAVEYMQKQLQLAKVSQKRMQEKSDMEKNIQMLAAQLQENPLAFLEERGYDVTELMEGHLEQVVKEMEMSPEEKAQREMERELEELRHRIRQEEEARQAAELAAQQEAAENALTEEIQTALDAHSSLPKDANTVRKMADLMLVADDHDINLSPKQAAELLEKEAMRDALNLLNAMEADKLEKFLGEENNKKLRGLRAKRAKKVSPVSQVKSTGSEAKKEKKAEKLRAKDFFRNLGNKPF